MSIAAASSGTPKGVLRLLSFFLGDDEYAVELSRVREIVPFTGAAWLPGFAAAVRGAVDLRGDVVPVVSLAAALGLQEPPVTDRSSLVVVEVNGRDEAALVGLITDSVRRIVELARGELGTAKGLERGLDEHLSGVAVDGEGSLRVVDLDLLLSANDQVRGPADVAASEGSTREG